MSNFAQKINIAVFRWLLSHWKIVLSGTMVCMYRDLENGFGGLYLLDGESRP